MKKHIIYIITIILSISVGVIGTIATIHYFPITQNVTNEKTVKTVSITETNSIKEAVNKIYNAVVVIESYQNGRQTSSGSGFVYKTDENYTPSSKRRHYRTNTCKYEWRIN